MIGMDQNLGGRMDDDAHLAQSIAILLTTPIGSRVMRRDYGSVLPSLIDQPATPVTLMRWFAAIALALLRWEPRVRLRQVRLEASPAEAVAGSFRFHLELERREETGARRSLALPLVLQFRPALLGAT